MRVAKQTEQTLLIRAGLPFLTSSSLRFDKATGLGICKRHGVLTNRRRMQFRLKEVTDARVLKQQRGSGVTYLASILFERDRSFRFRGSRSEARDTVTAIRNFLQIPSGRWR
jgi:hypothetical protein